MVQDAWRNTQTTKVDLFFNELVHFSFHGQQIERRKSLVDFVKITDCTVPHNGLVLTFTSFLCSVGKSAVSHSTMAAVSFIIFWSISTFTHLNHVISVRPHSLCMMLFTAVTIPVVGSGLEPRSCFLRTGFRNPSCNHVKQIKQLFTGVNRLESDAFYNKTRNERLFLWSEGMLSITTVAKTAATET